MNQKKKEGTHVRTLIHIYLMMVILLIFDEELFESTFFVLSISFIPKFLGLTFFVVPVMVMNLETKK